MYFKTFVATSALAATALAAPNAQWGRPSRYTRPTTTTVSSVDDCAAPTATTTAYITITEHDEATTSSATSSSSSSSGVVVDPTGGSSSSVVSECTATTAVETLTETAVSTATITDVATITVGSPGSSSTITIIDSSTITVTDLTTVTVPYPTGNSTAPLPTGSGVPEPPKKCITEKEADELAEVFRLLIQEYSDDLALAALTEDFVDYSSAVNILMNKGAQYPKNITGPTFSSRAQFMAGQGSQPLIPFERLNTFHGCDSVTARWWSSRSGAGQKTEAAAVPVVGNGILHVVPSEEPVRTHNGVTYNWRVKVLYSEFNSAAWLINLGVFKPDGPVDYFNTTSTNTTAKRSIESYDPSLRGAIL